MYQPVPVSHGQSNHKRLESTSKQLDHQPLKPHDDEDYSSDSSQDSNSISSASSIPETQQLQQYKHNNQRRHYRNQHQIIQHDHSQPPLIPPPTKQEQLAGSFSNKSQSKSKSKSKTTISRRSMPQSGFKRQSKNKEISKGATSFKTRFINKRPDPPTRSAPPLDRTEETKSSPSKYKVTILVCVYRVFLCIIITI